MDPKDDYSLIRKYYGEKMAQFCCHHSHFPKILETPGLLYKLMDKNFAHSKFLYNDIMNQGSMYTFINFIMKKYAAEIKEESIKVTDKTPEELLREAGYTLYECHSEKDIQSFRHFYNRKGHGPTPTYIEGETPEKMEGEELCTFNGNRLESDYVFFVVKDNVEKIKREDFEVANREDEYSTSVMSIQFSRTEPHVVSIKSRYNHGVNFPDATYGSDLERIIPGLTKAFEKRLGFSFDHNDVNDFSIPHYVVGPDGKFYKENAYSEHIYYCVNNTILLTNTNEVRKLETPQYLVFEKYILDMKTKTIKSLNEEDDSFIKSIGRINTVEVRNDGEGHKIVINGDIIIRLNKENKIISYKNNYVTNIEEYFLMTATEMEELSLPNVETISNHFMVTNRKLKTIDIKNVKSIGARFLDVNEDLEAIEIPNVKKINSNFLTANIWIKKIDLPNVKSIGDFFLTDNREISEINIPNIETIGDHFLTKSNIEELVLPNVKEIGDDFLRASNCKRISLPLVETIPDNFMSYVYDLSEIDIPNVETIGNSFLTNNEVLESIYLPKVKTVGTNFMKKAKKLKTIDLPSVESIAYAFASNCEGIRDVNLPKVTKIGNNFLEMARELTHIELPLVEDIGSSALDMTRIKRLELPKVEYIGSDFMRFCSSLEEIILPNVLLVGENFLRYPRNLKKVEVPKLNEYSLRYLSESIQELIKKDKEEKEGGKQI